MKKKNNLWLCSLCLLLCVCLCFAGCKPQQGSETEPQQTGTQPQQTYSIQVLTQGGHPMEGLTAFVYADSTLADLVAVVKTDAEGKGEFAYAAGDSYVAVLTDVPQGYLVEEYYPVTEDTRITLTAQLVEGELDNVRYKLGDVMQDFTFTALDGTEYKLSELLQTKKAVVLNFWYTECNPCKAEFPFLQEAYAEYSDVLEVLAIDPVESDNEAIAAFAQERGLTFPIGAGDPAWASAMPLTVLGYPTTVVIDRYGMITMIHGGSVNSAQDFKDVFAFFTAEDYTQKVVQSMEELLVSEPDPEAVENPTDISGLASFELTLDPGQVHYLNIHKMMNVWLQINNSDIYVEYGVKTYKASNGSVGLLFSAPSTFEPAQLGFGNSGDERQTFTVYLSNLAGSYENPYSLQLGQFNASVSAGNDQGVYFSFTAPEDGYFKLRCISTQPKVGYGLSIQNLVSYAFASATSDAGGEIGQDGYLTMPMNVGEKIRIAIATQPDESYNYPGAAFTMEAKFEAGEVEDIVKEEKIFCAVTLTDETQAPIAGVGISLTGQEGGKVSMQTDENGVASAWVTKDSYTGNMIVPAGYQAKTTAFSLDEENPFLSLKLDTVQEEAKETYTVRVTDQDGAPISNMVVVIGSTFGTTDQNGAYAVDLVKGEYSVMIVVPAGYTANSISYTFPENDTTLAITLRKGQASTGPDDVVGDSTGGGGSGGTGGNTDGGGGNTGGNESGSTGGGSTGGGGSSGNQQANMVNYTVKLVDKKGYPVTNIVATFMKNGIPAGIANANASGNAVASLEKGDYTVSLISSRGDALSYDPAQAVLSSTVTTTTITVVAKPDHSTNQDSYFWGNSYRLYEGSTQLDLTNTTNYEATEWNVFMYVFYPATSGEYEFTISSGVLGYYGSVNYLNLNDSTQGSGKFTVTVRDGEFANESQPLLVLGVKAASGQNTPVVTISRVADAPEELPWITYEPKYEPTVFELKTSGTITYVDLTGNAQITKGRDGYYLNGKKLYMNIGNAAPYVSMNEMLGLRYDAGSDSWADTSMGTGFRGYIYENDVAVAREDFTDCMRNYVKACDPANGLYPLNDDLIYMLQNGGAYMGWWNSEHPNYLFTELEGVNTDIAWMFACCYLQ